MSSEPLTGVYQACSQGQGLRCEGAVEWARVRCAQGTPPALDTRRAQSGQTELSGAGQGVMGWGPGKHMSGMCFGNQGTLLAGSLVPRPASRSRAPAPTSTGPPGQEPWASGQRGGPERT